MLSSSDLSLEDTLDLGLSALDFLSGFAGSFALDDGFILKTF